MHPGGLQPKLSAVKAARKQMQARPASGSASDDGPGSRSASRQDEDSDSDHSLERRPNRGVRPLMPTAAKRGILKKKEVKFDVQEDLDSDDAAMHVVPSRHRPPIQVQKNPVFQPPSPPPIQAKQTGSRPRRSGPKELDLTRERVFKSTRYDESPLRGQVKEMRKKRTGKEQGELEWRYARMSIGSAAGGQSGPPENSGDPTHDRGRLSKWYLRRGKVTLRGRHSNRNDESETDDDYEEVQQPPRPRNQKAVKSKSTGNASQVGKKSMARRSPQPPSHESDIEVEDIDPYDAAQDDVGDEPPSAHMTDTAEEEDVLDTAEPSQALLGALERLSLNVVRLHKMRRLPFLRRNIQSGFRLRCQMVGVDTKPAALPRASISVVYTSAVFGDARNHPGGTRIEVAKTSMKDWMCPLCDLHTKFNNQKMLDKHLAWDHSGVNVSWNEHYTTLTLTIPNSQPESNPALAHQVPTRALSTSEFSADSRPIQRNESADSDERSITRASTTPFSVASELGSGSLATIQTSVDEDLKPKQDTPDYSVLAVADGSTRMSTVSGRSVSRSLTSDLQDGLGPAATPPYLPETDERGNVYYSCRPGGPRLYDFMNTLSLKPYGVLKWVIIDREEELFELDDILDEDKTMLAIWYRWIFLNRNKFVANYFDGTKAFVRENWQLINQGAGLLALRTWLLVLLVNNFLLPAEVATLMRYYQELADIQLQN